MLELRTVRIHKTRRRLLAERTAQVALGLLAMAFVATCTQAVGAGPLLAGAAKVDVTDREAGPVNDPLYVKTLVIKSDSSTVVLITVDAVAIGEIGPVGDDYLPRVRAGLEKELGIPPASVLINASHCHGVVCDDIAERTLEAVKTAARDLVPVRVGAGVGHEDRIMENRRIVLKSGREADVRRAYSLPPDEEIASVGPVDPEIGILRVDRLDGQTLAVVYNFACHPIQGVPSGGNTADLVGFASTVIEENLGEDAVALFLQGCGGDINPVLYKDVDHPRDAEPLGNLLGLSALRAVREIECRADEQLTVTGETLTLPRRDQTERIRALETERERLLASLKGTSLNLKTFLPLVVKYKVSGDFPSYYAHRYLHDEQLGRDGFRQLDAENYRNMKQYMENIYTMEALTRLQTNLALLAKHQQSFVESGRTVDVELGGLRIGNFVLTTFPGELTVRIGLNLKQRSPHEHTFVAGYTNGYIYYAPTSEQLLNAGTAQEDCDCILAPEWQALYEERAAAILERL